MNSWWVVYYIISVLLWMGLTALALASWRQDFPDRLAAHPRLLIALLGIDRLPASAGRILRRFYLFLAGGWTWLLVWSWWLAPLLKNYFYRSVASAKTLQLAQISTLIMIGAYGAFGFFCIGRGVSIWYKEIYRSK